MSPTHGSLDGPPGAVGLAILPLLLVRGTDVEVDFLPMLESVGSELPDEPDVAPGDASREAEAPELAWPSCDITGTNSRRRALDSLRDENEPGPKIGDEAVQGPAWLPLALLLPLLGPA